MTPTVATGAVNLHVAHLNMIQGIIGRMSRFSANAKNFCITICAAIIAVAFQQQTSVLNWVAVGIVVIFFLMDAYYLSLERRYRDFYEEVAARDVAANADMSLKTNPLSLADFSNALVSISVLPFYAVLMASMVGLLYAASHVQHPSPKERAVGVSGRYGGAKETGKQQLS